MGVNGNETRVGISTELQDGLRDRLSIVMTSGEPKPPIDEAPFPGVSPRGAHLRAAIAHFSSDSSPYTKEELKDRRSQVAEATNKRNLRHAFISGTLGTIAAAAIVVGLVKADSEPTCSGQQEVTVQQGETAEEIARREIDGVVAHDLDLREIKVELRGKSKAIVNARLLSGEVIKLPESCKP